MLPIRKPTLLLNKERVIRNIKTMSDRAIKSGVRFRPHFKTHQSAEIGAWFREFGVEAITVSSVDMARYFAKNGWQDIVIAFPVNILEIEAINRLAEQVRLGLLVESEETISFLAAHLTAPVDIWLKVDVGYGRTGVYWEDADKFDALATRMATAEGLTLRGLLTHGGHTYKARSRSEIKIIYQNMIFKLKAARSRLEMAGSAPIDLSLGDTPSCSVVDELRDVDEIRPGNFVFYDVTQLHIGACQEDQIAVALACPIVAKHPEQKKLVVYGGAVHLSKEFILTKDNKSLFGYVALPTEDGWGPRLAGAYVSGLSQEHGQVKVDSATLESINIGDIIIILPVHSCLTANLMRRYQTLTDETITLGDYNVT